MIFKTYRNNIKETCRQIYDHLLLVVDERKFYITVEAAKTKRSIKQNSLYWKWNTYLEYLIGIDKNHIHYLFRGKFLLKDLTEIEKAMKPEILKNILWGFKMFEYNEIMFLFADVLTEKTKELKTIPFNEYLERIRLFVLETIDENISLPYPEDDNFSDFEKELERIKKIKAS
ncbi:MAG: hypothetical protein GY849_02485 [Deltaproteobacteria bacterium]|nr:hypothetical protein [Deltaproteobacteria bacterium]